MTESKSQSRSWRIRELVTNSIKSLPRAARRRAQLHFELLLSTLVYPSLSEPLATSTLPETVTPGSGLCCNSGKVSVWVRSPCRYCIICPYGGGGLWAAMPRGRYRLHLPYFKHNRDTTRYQALGEVQPNSSRLWFKLVLSFKDFAFMKLHTWSNTTFRELRNFE